MTVIPAFQLDVVAESSSTNAELLSRQDSIHGKALLAHRQTAGHGRRGRDWDSGSGNVALSFGLEFFGDNHLLLPRLPFVAGVAAYNVLHTFVPHAGHLSLKWPNDVMLGKKKLGGLLMEVRQLGTNVRVVVGIGINLNSAPLLPDATCLKETTGLTLRPEEFAQPFLAEVTAMDELLGDFSALKELWEARCAHMDQTIFYGDRDQKESMRKAKALKLLDSGALLVRDEETSREVTLVSEDTSLRI